MRIRVSKDMKYLEAFEAVIHFLESNMDDFPYLRTDMYIYLYLKTADGKVCIFNDMDYYYDGNSMIDTIQERIDQGKQWLLTNIRRKVRRGLEAINDAEEILKRYKKNLYIAEEKGFSTAGKWRNDIEVLESRIDGELANKVRISESLQRCLDAKNYAFHVYTKTEYNSNKVAIRILAEIDPECKEFGRPVYYVPEEFTFEKPEEFEWIEV